MRAFHILLSNFATSPCPRRDRAVGLALARLNASGGSGEPSFGVLETVAWFVATTPVHNSTGRNLREEVGHVIGVLLPHLEDVLDHLSGGRIVVGPLANYI